MSRLHKKCVVASAGLHLLLLLVLFVGPAFLAPSDKQTQDLPVLDFVPVKTVDALMSGGGDPKGRLPQEAPEPAPPQRVVRHSEPRPEPQPVKPSQPSKSDFEMPKKTVKRREHRYDISTTVVKRHASESSKSRKAAERQAREAAEAQRAAAAAIRQTVAGIHGHLSGSTSIELKGPGGGGVPYANWLQAVKSVYERAWVVPDGVTDNSATTGVTITIGRDGRVLSSRIIRSSRSPVVDASVQLTLDRVRYTAPLPDDAKESQRTVTINFNVESKLSG